MNNLSDLILSKLKQDCRGKENSIRREDLLRFCQAFDEDITDREMRDIYSRLPIVVCEKGLFYPICSEEIEDFRHYMKAKALSILRRWRIVAKAHPNLIHDEFDQMELF